MSQLPTENTLSLEFVEGLFEQYRKDPASVPLPWQTYFKNMGLTSDSGTGPRLRPKSLFRDRVASPKWVGGAPANGAVSGHASGSNGLALAGESSASLAKPPARGSDEPLASAVLQHKVDQLIRNYRVRGHRAAKVDPLGLPQMPPPEMDPAYHGLTEADMDRPFSTQSIAGPDVQTLRQIIERLQNTYCRSIGAQFMHIDDLKVRQWLQQRMESTQNRIQLGRAEQLRVLKRLTDAVVFEQFIQKKYIGAKSFSLEGGETLIPLLDLAIEKAGKQGVSSIVLGMAHRGRLNVLANIMNKPAEMIFREFEDKTAVAASVQAAESTGATSANSPGGTAAGVVVAGAAGAAGAAGGVGGIGGAGDVKYHLGYTSDWQTADGVKVHLSLCFNPSHLEFINPVALGRTRAKQDRSRDTDRRQVMAILVHGDAAFIGEGISQETLNLSELPGYFTGGALHIIVNNQIGFTTTPSAARSCTYASDVAKMLQVPIFHVNGEDPEAVAAAMQLAMDFRQEFRQDVVIDMYCYRRRGHNEGDEPAFTQPLLYQAIAQRPPVKEAYIEHLMKMGSVSREELTVFEQYKTEELEMAHGLASGKTQTIVADAKSANRRRGIWAAYQGGYQSSGDAKGASVQTAVHREDLLALLELLTRLPQGFKPHPKIEKWLQARREMAQGHQPLDWAAGEALAYATLLRRGLRVRLSGQDVQRGTFSHRHSVLHDVQTGQTHIPLANMAPDQGPIEIVNSPLSEAGVLGFEYGYSLDWPDGLTIWEAQFGDFCNVAQVIIDQFIASAEDKWNRLSGLVIQLPHGFEGQGPEHSSGRMERWLNLAAKENFQVTCPTTPAQMFHLLRRQVLGSLRKPLIVFTPKSLLRHPEVISPIQDLSQGTFRRVIADEAVDPAKARRVLMCTGKIYYELRQRRQQLKLTDVAILRLEQLYPLPKQELEESLAGYADGTPLIWVQEEPENMGAWRYLHSNVHRQKLLPRFPLGWVSRPEAASPATGSHARHKLEQERVLAQAFEGL